mgnify:CR=1|jgi:hypothetical protein
MYLGLTLALESANKQAQSFKGIGVCDASLSAVSRFSGSGSLVGESIVTLVGSLGNVGTLATATGEGVVTVPLFNQQIPAFETATGECIDNNTIGIGAVASASGMDDLVDDTSPQLGGDLDLNSKNLDFPTTANVSDVLDEDDMNSDSDTKLSTQQSIKAYTDNQAVLWGIVFGGG